MKHLEEIALIQKADEWSMDALTFCVENIEKYTNNKKNIDKKTKQEWKNAVNEIYIFENNRKK